MNDFTFSVPCLFGLEGLVGDELRRLEMAKVRVENGRVRVYHQTDYRSRGAEAAAQAQISAGRDKNQ